MKLFASILCFLLTFQSLGQNQEKTFSFKAQVFHKGKPLKRALIEVLDGGNLVEETTSKGGGKFDFKLTAEKEYMVEISMENYRTKVIWISTKNTKELDFKVPVFAFDVYLEEEKITPYDELSEIPVTLIKYHKKKQEFYMDRTYANAVKNKRKEIKNSMLKQR